MAGFCSHLCIPLWLIAAMVLQTLELLAAHFAQWACSAAFPEMMHLPLQQLRRFAKQCKVERFRSSAKALAAALEANTAYVAARRAADAFAPKDTASVLRFLASDDASQKVCFSIVMMPRWPLFAF